MRRLTVAEAADVAGRHPDTVRRALADGSLPGWQRVKGGTWMVKPEDLAAWMDGTAS